VGTPGSASLDTAERHEAGPRCVSAEGRDALWVSGADHRVGWHGCGGPVRNAGAKQGGRSCPSA